MINRDVIGNLAHGNTLQYTNIPCNSTCNSTKFVAPPTPAPSHRSTLPPQHPPMYVHTFDRDNCISFHHPFTVLSYAAIPSSIGHLHWTNGESPAGEHVVRAGERSWEHSLPEDGGSGVTGGCTLQSDVLPNNGLRVCGWESDDGRGGVGEDVCSVGERVPTTPCVHANTHAHTHSTHTRTHPHTHTHTHPTWNTLINY